MKDKLLEPGIVLKTTAFSESDLIVTLLTKSLGKISVVIRSARSSRKRFLGGIEIFDSGIFELQEPKGKSHLYTANNISSRESFGKLRENLNKLSLASIALEVTNHFCPDDDTQGSELFKALFICLREIAKAENLDLERGILQLYLLIVLQITGHDACEASLDVQPQILTLWQEMLSKNKVLLAEEKALTKLGLVALIGFIEEIIGKKLNSNFNPDLHLTS